MNWWGLFYIGFVICLCVVIGMLVYKDEKNGLNDEN